MKENDCKHEDLKLVGAIANTHLCNKCGGNLVDEEYIKHPCPNCGTITIQPKWLVDKYEKEEDDAVYCSEGCKYHAETGKSAEEY